MRGISHKFLHEHAFALIDRQLFSGEEWPAGLRVEPLVPPQLEHSAEMLPGLVSLRELPEHTTAATLELITEQAARGEPTVFSVLLKATATAERLARHFRATLVARAPEYELYLRQFDPRVFVQYQWLLTPEQRLRMFGPVTGWTVNLDSEWRTYAPPVEGRPATRLQLTAAQAKSIEALQRINRAMASSPALKIDLRRERAQQAFGLLDRAHLLGLNKQRCQVRFLEHGWIIHPQFYRHPEISCRLQNMSSEDDFPYLAATSDLDLDAAAIARIRDELEKGDWP